MGIKRTESQPLTKVLLQVGLDVGAIGCSSLSAVVSADGQSQAKVLNFINKTKPSCSSGLDIIKSPTCSNTQRWLQFYFDTLKLMGIFNWFKGWGTAIQIANALDGSIQQFPNTDNKKLDALIKTKDKWSDKDIDVIKKRIIEGYDKKVNSENVDSFGQKYLEFYQTIFPNQDGQEIIKKINSNEVEKFIFARINDDEALDPNEINEIIEYCKSLNVTDFDSKEKIRKEYDYYVTNWELDNGQFPNLPSDFILKKNEVCIYRLDNCELLERKAITKKLNYSGPSYRIKITKGFSYRLGSYNVSSQKQIVDVSKGRGLLNVTTKHIMFKSSNGMTTITNSSIVDIEPYKDAVMITKSSGKPLIIKTQDAVRLYQYIRAATRQ